MPETPDLSPSGFRQVTDSAGSPPAQVQPGVPGASGTPTAPATTTASGAEQDAFVLPVPPTQPLPSRAPKPDSRRRFVVLATAVVLFGILGAITSWLAIPSMEEHLEAESLERLEEAGIAGATVDVDGRTATISNLTGEDAERAEAILDDEWGIRDAKLATDNDPETVEVTADTVPPPGTSEPALDEPEPSATTEPEADVAPETTVATAKPDLELDLDDELADLELRFNSNGAFQPGSASLTPESEAILTEAAPLLQQFPEATIQIEGHTDDDGDQIDNLLLSQARADAVVEFLVDNGIDLKRLVAVGLGENEPVADNSTAAGREKNRRTEFFAVR